jgi:hypothetical protein
VAVRIIMILLSAQGFSPAEIADLLHYDPHTVRRWIGRRRRPATTRRPRTPGPSFRDSLIDGAVPVCACAGIQGGAQRRNTALMAGKLFVVTVVLCETTLCVIAAGVP